MIIGVVAEGKTDFVVLDSFIRSWWDTLGTDENLELRPLQPYLDATSGEWGDGGWTFVKAWCEDNPPEVRANQIFQPLFAHETPCDVLLVHLDGDVIDHFIRATPDVLPLSETPDKLERAEKVVEVLNKWLWENEDQTTDEYYHFRHINAPAVQATEAWLISGLDHSIGDPEEVDTEVELLRIKPSLKYMKKGKPRVRKSERKWRTMSNNVSEHLPHIRTRCPSLNRLFCSIHALQKT